MNSMEFTPQVQQMGPSQRSQRVPNLRGSKHHTSIMKCADVKMDINEFKMFNQNVLLHYSNELMSPNYKENEKSKNRGQTPVNIAYHMVPNVPINLMPPPPHNLICNNNNNNNVMGNANNRRGSWKSELRCNSPHGSESDDSCRSNKSRESPPHNNNGYNGNKGRNKNGSYMETSLICNKFSNSSPSIFYNSSHMTQNNAHYKPRYYVNSSNQHHRNAHHRDKKIRYSDIPKRVYGLMERFTSRSLLFRITPNPPSLINGNEWDILNQSIWDVYQVKAQKESTYLRKLEVWKMVYLNIQKILHRYGLFLVGSTMSGLGLDSSDVDMCLLVRPCHTDARSDALGYLQNICALLQSCDFIKSPEVIMAKVPILKFRDANYGFEVDLNCNNSVGIRNTHLMNCYSRLDWRVRPLVAIVKTWAQANAINDAKRMTISSYSLALMVIHYLQCGVTPPAIPCLQGMYPNMFSAQIEIHDIDLQEEVPRFHSDNKQSIGELFLGFLHYYTVFDYNQFAISVREATVLSKEECRFTRSPKNDATQWKLLCIEEPFDLTNTARSVYDPDTFDKIKNVFRDSYHLLLKTKKLSSILPNNSAGNQR